MSKTIETENTPSEPIAGEEQRGNRTAELLFNPATLGTAAVACAIGGPKMPPWEGD